MIPSTPNLVAIALTRTRRAGIGAPPNTRFLSRYQSSTISSAAYATWTYTSSQTRRRRAAALRPRRSSTAGSWQALGTLGQKVTSQPESL